MKLYQIELIHEATGEYMNFEYTSDAKSDDAVCSEILSDLSVVILSKEDLTEEKEFDTIKTNQLQKGSEMQHEHYWDTPSDKSLVAECACGEQLERVQE